VFSSTRLKQALLEENQMQHRMKQNPLPYERVKEILAGQEVGRFVTVNKNGYPYAVPVHFVYYEGKIYLHGLLKGQKLDNIKGNRKVCFEVDQMHGYLKDGALNPCSVNTDYESIIILGDANIIQEFEFKQKVLDQIVQKYAPEMSHVGMSEKMVRGTAVVEIKINECTGKYYNQSSLDRDNA
jgi:nitroimidazol reductase NimA-like FMN-containing flavoprotein (pyridoxamine 5'-phosphate oxidase superfamily)